MKSYYAPCYLLYRCMILTLRALLLHHANKCDIHFFRAVNTSYLYPQIGFLVPFNFSLRFLK